MTEAGSLARANRTRASRLRRQFPHSRGGAARSHAAPMPRRPARAGSNEAVARNTRQSKSGSGAPVFRSDQRTRKSPSTVTVARYFARKASRRAGGHGAVASRRARRHQAASETLTTASGKAGAPSACASAGSDPAGAAAVSFARTNPIRKPSWRSAWSVRPRRENASAAHAANCGVTTARGGRPQGAKTTVPCASSHDKRSRSQAGRAASGRFGGSVPAVPAAAAHSSKGRSRRARRVSAAVFLFSPKATAATAFQESPSRVGVTRSSRRAACAPAAACPGGAASGNRTVIRPAAPVAIHAPPSNTSQATPTDPRSARSRARASSSGASEPGRNTKAPRSSASTAPANPRAAAKGGADRGTPRGRATAGSRACSHTISRGSVSPRTTSSITKPSIPGGATIRCRISSPFRRQTVSTSPPLRVETCPSVASSQTMPSPAPTPHRAAQGRAASGRLPACSMPPAPGHRTDTSPPAASKDTASRPLAAVAAGSAASGIVWRRKAVTSPPGAAPAHRGRQASNRNAIPLAGFMASVPAGRFRESRTTRPATRDPRRSCLPSAPGAPCPPAPAAAAGPSAPVHAAWCRGASPPPPHG